MRTDPINNENRNISVPKAGIAGAALGYAATYLVPLTTEEHKNYFTDSVKNDIKYKAMSARAAEIKLIEEEIKNNNNIKPIVADIFEKSKEALEFDPKSAITKLHDADIEHTAKKSLVSYFKRVKNSGKTTEIKENLAASLAAKKGSRVAMYSALVGAFALMSLAVLKNALNTFFPAKETKKPASKHEMTDLDYIMECAEGPAAIYIYGFGKNSKKA